MAKTFVAVNDRVQSLLRDCTRRAPLYAAGEAKAIQYEVRSENLSNSYYSLAAFHALQGFSVDETSLSRWRVQEPEKPWVAHAAGYFDATRLDHRCSGDLRLNVPGRGACMVAGELLAFGVGALRPAGYSAANSWEFAEYGRFATPLEIVYRRIGALCCGPASSQFGTAKEIYYSTNLIYGDALGELEQLWERRADTDFLGLVARHLQRLSQWAEAPAPPQAPLNFTAVVKLHLRAQALWRRPPGSARSLLRRIEFILGHTVIDSAPRTAFTPPGRPSGTERDRSGYDGWLTDTGLALN